MNVLHNVNRIFEPSVSIFEKALFINYKKVGTRFFRTVASGGLDACDTNNKQIDFMISNESMTYENKHVSNTINYKFSNRYITAPWHTMDKLAESFPRWKTDDQFLEEMGVKSYTELFFENEKDIIFVIRNPLERFFSGVVQCAAAYFYSLEDMQEEYDFFKKVTGFSDDTIKIISHLYKNTQFTDQQLASSLPIEIIVTTYKYLLEYRWHLLVSDIHVQPYLSHFLEFMHNVKDSSKIKIIDLKHLRSEKSITFLSNLYENKQKGLYVEDVENTMRTLQFESNSRISNILASAYSSGSFITKTSGMNIYYIEEYINHEYTLYNELLSSSHFINLKD
jgi:hypothetical protein